ncbi:Ig-like domain-containing protein [Bradymonas sediminis]|uniref:Uncharacterized protein n=1 Tax=Bradymonas sediminis TaxID=1548548 RepID=A0A2Z4FNM5_9DELT|nr:Ig-like domain-containing protein [Bradymonas sediminis]AWV90543.1 hypothetical protein DN745_14890 [Bradymonas sediminis]TDP72062.1 alpha-tubulin suppressor-like RCC1 family protein [Bradymonas sediminis]
MSRARTIFTVRRSAATLLALFLLAGAASCSLYEDFEPLGGTPEADGDADSPQGDVIEGDVDTVNDTDAGSDADALSHDVDASAPAQAASVDLAPAEVLLFPGEQTQIAATVRDGAGNIRDDFSLDWSTSDETVATVDAAGRVTAVGLGDAQLRASVGDVSATLQVEVVRWEQISARYYYSCGVLSNHDAYCWGRNNVYGVLGNGALDSGVDDDHPNSDANVNRPTRISGNLAFSSVSASNYHACGLTVAGKAYCWGVNAAGHLGNGGSEFSPVPVPVAGVHIFVEIQLGTNHACGLDAENDLHCWGYNGEGQLGLDTGGANYSSVPRMLSGHKFVEFSLGSVHTCAIDTSGVTYCWGGNSYGQLGVGDVVKYVDPTPVDTTEEFVKIAAGMTYTCGMTAAGEIYCWGDNYYGQLGDGTTTVRHAPVRASPGHTYKNLYVGPVSVCAGEADDRVYCWGFGGQGNLGNGAPAETVLQRLPVVGGYTWRSMSLGIQHTCGLAHGDDRAFCWGDNDNGEIGNGMNQEFVLLPTAVESP